MTDTTPMTTDALLLSLSERLETALTGDREALPEAVQSFRALHAALTAGAPLPVEWTAAVAPTTPSPVTIDRETDGTYLLTSPDTSPGASSVAHVEVPTFDAEDGQSGLDFFAALPTPVSADTAVPARAVRFPKPPKAPRGQPRRNSPATIADLPIDAPSMFPSGPPPVGLHHPSTSHAAIKYTRAEIAAGKRSEMFWMVVDTAQRGLCVFEATAALQRRYPDKDMHHGKVSGTMSWLMDHGYVEDSNLRRKTPSNNDAIAWVPTARALERIRLGYETRTVTPSHAA
jgi:hypothetical protein